MPRWPLSGGITLGILASVALAGCGLGDVFRASGPAAGVFFVYTGATVLDVGDTVPLTVAVVAGGDTLPNPRLAVRSLDTTRLTLNAAHDTLIAVRQGNADLEVRLVSSVITGPGPDTLLRIQVRP